MRSVQCVQCGTDSIAERQVVTLRPLQQRGGDAGQNGGGGDPCRERVRAVGDQLLSQQVLGAGVVGRDAGA
jgi:hypothetical protein